MLRPEAIGIGAVDNKSQIAIRYPAFDDNFPPIEEKMDFKKIHTVVPLRFNFVAPIQVKPIYIYLSISTLNCILS